jgi:hypothetical protein
MELVPLGHERQLPSPLCIPRKRPIHAPAIPLTCNALPCSEYDALQLNGVCPLPTKVASLRRG